MGLDGYQLCDTADSTYMLVTKMMSIGDWNMDTTASKSVAHGLSIGDIRFVSCLIRNDAGTTLYTAHGHDGGTTPFEIDYIDATNVVLARKNGSIFDATEFDATSYNRGWVTIQYTK